MQQRDGHLQTWMRLHAQRMYLMHDLTKPQRAVCERLLLGESNKEIAEHVGTSARMVERHITELNQLFGTQDRTQIVLFLLGYAYQPMTKECAA